MLKSLLLQTAIVHSHSTVLLYASGFRVKNHAESPNVLLHYNMVMHCTWFSGAVLGINTELSYEILQSVLDKRSDLII